MKLRPDKRKLLMIEGVVFIVVLVAGVWLYQRQTAQAIDSFEKCAAKYPVMESYPEQCNTPDGRHFVKQY
jgi:hypothetical protein